MSIIQVYQSEYNEEEVNKLLTNEEYLNETIDSTFNLLDVNSDGILDP